MKHQLDESGYLPRCRRFKENGLEGILDPDGKVIIPAIYSKVTIYHALNMEFPAFAIAIRDDRYYLIDNKGNEIFSAEEIRRGESKHIVPAIFKNNNKWGIVGKSGNIILPAEFDEIISDLENFWLKHDDKWGLIIPNGRRRYPIFDAVEADEKHRAVVTLDGNKFYLNKKLECTTDATDCVQLWILDDKI